MMMMNRNKSGAGRGVVCVSRSRSEFFGGKNRNGQEMVGLSRCCACSIEAIRQRRVTQSHNRQEQSQPIREEPACGSQTPVCISAIYTWYHPPADISCTITSDRVRQ